MQEITIGKDCREKLISGINKIANPVVSTLGFNGRNVIFEKDGIIQSTKDGVSVAKAIEKLKDPVENLGANLIKQAALKTAEAAGDGTTTSTLLAQQIVNKGMQHLNNGANSSEIRIGIDIATKHISKFIRKEISEDITDESQLKQIASISSNNDSEVGELVSSAINRVGKDGVAHIEESQTGETILENVEGIQFNKGYKSHYFVTNNENMTSYLKDPYILLVNKKLTQAKSLLPILESVSSENKPLLIISEDVEGEALATLIVNKMRNTLKVCAVKAPDFGDRRKLFMEDISIMTGGELVDSDKGMKLDKFEKVWFGTCRLATITKEKTTIIDGGGEEEKINNRISEIQTQIHESKTPFEKEKLQERLARLVEGVSIIHVGGNSDSEIKEKKDRVEDALHATKAAISEGILPGGGTSLLHAQKKTNSDIFKETNKKYGPRSDVNLGAQLVLDACLFPTFKLLENAGYASKDIYEDINRICLKTSRGIYWDGFNLITNKIENLREAGIVDSTKVVITALKNASSIAGLILLTEASVVNIEEEKEDPNNINANLMQNLM